MRKLYCRIASATVIFTLLLSVFVPVIPTASLNEKTTYSNSFTVNIPYSLTDLDGKSENVKLGVADNLASAVPGTDHRRIWWDTFVGDPTGWSEGGIPADTSIPLVGYNIQKADGSNASSGEITYYSRFALKDVRFDTSYSVSEDYWIAKPLEFYSSSDGITFKKITTVRDTAGVKFTRDVCDGMYSQIYDTCSFAESEDIHYIRIVSVIKSDNVFGKAINRIYGIDYNTFRKTVDYSHRISPESYYSVSGNLGENARLKHVGAVPNSSIPVGWCLTNAGGNAAADGEIVYDSLAAFKEVRFDSSYQTVSDGYAASPIESLEFYASSDGVTYGKLDTERITGDSALNPNLPDAYAHIYDEAGFKESEDIHYLKIRVKTNPNNNFYLPRIFGIDYTSYGDGGDINIPSKYQKEVIITPDSEDIALECQDGVVLDSPKRFNGGWGPYHIYTFYRGQIADSAKPENNADGSVIIKSGNNKPITDWSFGGVCGPNRMWSGSFSFFASSDGRNWRRIEDISEMGAAYIEGWGAYEYEYRGRLSPEYNLRYIKITANSGEFAFLPAYRYFLYSTEGFDPDNLKPAESYTNRMREENYYEKNESGYLFRTGSVAVDFDLHVTEPISDKTAIAVTVSSETAESEIDYLKTAVRVLVNNNGDGTGEYRYYNTYFSSSGITNIKITFNGAKFLYLDYNLASGLEDTARRHYDDVPIVEPFEDLKLKSSSSKFYEGEQNGIGLIENATLHNNGNEEASAYIGGANGFLSSAGQRDYSIIMETPYVNDFKFRYSFSSEESAKIRQIKAYGINEWEGSETEIPLVRYFDERYASAGYRNYIFRPADRSKLPKCEYHWVRIEVLCETYTDYSELMEFEYFYDIPKTEGMPALKKVPNGLKEMLDSFEIPMLSVQNGGKAAETANLKWANERIGYNGFDNVIMQDVYGAESYIVYNCDGIKGFDIRGYRQKRCVEKLQIFVSSDGEEWTTVKTEYAEKMLLSNWLGFSYTANGKTVPSNANYLRVLFDPEAEGDDFAVSDIQIFYNGIRNGENITDDGNTDADITDNISIDNGDNGNTVTDDGNKTAVLRRKKLVIRRRIKPIVFVLGGCVAAAVLAAVATVTVVLIKNAKKRKRLK